MTKWWTGVLLLSLVLLQVRLWSPDGGIAELRQLEFKVAEQKMANESLRKRNKELHNQVMALRNSDDAIEQYARLRLGMIKPGETFYRFVPAKKK